VIRRVLSASTTGACGAPSPPGTTEIDTGRACHYHAPYKIFSYESATPRPASSQTTWTSQETLRLYRLFASGRRSSGAVCVRLSDVTLGQIRGTCRSVPERLGMLSERSPWNRRERLGEDGQAGNIRCLAGAERERVRDRPLRLIGGATRSLRSVISIEPVIGELLGMCLVSASAWGCGDG
jgi:hypothetical protein